MRPEEITLAIFEKYSPVELATTAAAMAQAQGDLEGVELEKKTSDGAFKERINSLGAQVSELAHKYNKGGETAQIGCKIRYDIPAPGQKSYIRFDSEEIVEVHDMTTEEKQETFQFPLSTGAPAEVQAIDSPATASVSPESFAEKAAKIDAKLAPPITEITFKDIKAVAAHIGKLQNGQRKAAMIEMQKSIASKLLVRGKVIGPDGRLEDVQSAEVADKLASAWLALAMDELDKPPATEEITHLCPYPGCIDFAFHEGGHRFPPPTEAKSDHAAPEPLPQKEKKAKPRRRPPVEPSQPGAPA